MTAALKALADEGYTNPHLGHHLFVMGMSWGGEYFRYVSIVAENENEQVACVVFANELTDDIELATCNISSGVEEIVEISNVKLSILGSAAPSDIEPDYTLLEIIPATDNELKAFNGQMAMNV